MSEELKPCPFCGVAASMMLIGDGPKVWPWCKQCDFGLPTLAQWNSRAFLPGYRLVKDEPVAWRWPDPYKKAGFHITQNKRDAGYLQDTEAKVEPLYAADKGES